jgi:endonuclease VIII
VDLDVVIGRLGSSAVPTVAEVLLDQQVACGIGNVWKCELLFLHRLEPFTRPEAVPEDLWRRVYADAQRRMRAAVDGPRNTTGRRQASERLFVYGRGGRPCWRCGSRIAVRTHGGDLPRTTWWCPSCQRER